METKYNNGYPCATFTEAGQDGEPVEVLDLTDTPDTSPLATTHDPPRRAEKTRHPRLTLTLNPDHGLTPNQAKTASSPRTSHSPRPTTTTSEDDDGDDDEFEDIDALPLKKRRLLSHHNNSNNNPASATTTTTRQTQQQQQSHTPLTSRRHTHTHTLLANLQQSLAHERRLRRAAERRLASHTRQAAPLTRVAARLARWVEDMYAEHRRQRDGEAEAEAEVERFLGEIREDAGGREAWGRLLGLGAWLRDHVDGDDGV